MNIVLLNWAGGENDPFTPVNEALARKFKAIGREAKIINLDSNFDSKFSNELDRGVDFVVCCQGIGSTIQNTNSNQTIWDDLGIPLMCLHGDHPSHNISNHSGKSHWITHLYSSASFARYANTHLTRQHTAYSHHLPNLFQNAATNAEHHRGDFFVIPKNLDDTQKILKSWEEKYPKKIYHALREIASSIECEFSRGNTVDHHEIIEAFLTNPFFQSLGDLLKTRDQNSLRHYTHAIIDKYYRNFASEHVLLELPDVKIKIFGRGWERFKDLNNRNHEFYPGERTVDSAFQYQSNYGIIDVAPICDMLHDRTTRATAHKNGFLIASSWNFFEFLDQDFSDLFFSGIKNNLREKAESVIKDPNSHRQLARQFSDSYNQIFNFYRFAKDLEMTSRCIKSNLKDSTSF